MFFKRLKSVSIKKNIAKILNQRFKDFRSSKVQSVGIIFDYEAYHDYDFFHGLLKELGIRKNNIRFIAKIDAKKTHPNSWDSFYSLEDFDWLGKHKNQEIDEGWLRTIMMSFWFCTPMSTMFLLFTFY